MTPYITILCVVGLVIFLAIRPSLRTMRKIPGLPTRAELALADKFDGYAASIHKCAEEEMLQFPALARSKYWRAVELQNLAVDLRAGKVDAGTAKLKCIGVA